jgi:hypothetical protein
VLAADVIIAHACDADDQHVIALEVRDLRQRVPVGHEAPTALGADELNRHCRPCSVVRTSRKARR